MQTIFLDECGYTGEDLAAPDQPIFVIATHSLPEEQCRGLRQEFFPGLQAQTLKHSALQRRRPHWEAIIRLLERVLRDSTVVRVGIMHKPFALIAKIVDHIIEDAMYADGIDIYERGGNVALANLLYFVLSTERETVFEPLTRAFQRAVRTRDKDKIQEFCRLLHAKHVDEFIDDTLDYIRLPLRRLPANHIEQLPPGALDVTLSTALRTMYSWREIGFREMTVIHDASSNMAKQKSLWDAVLSPSAPPARVGRGDQIVEFPIGVTDTRFERDEQWAGLQVADVIAGATARWTKWMHADRSESDAYGCALHGLLFPLIESFVATATVPVPRVEPDDPTPSGTTDPNEYITNLIRGLPG